ncbi:uncharacterized protein METZ01_LOCUS392476 [marine metagenome]|uniref:Uncharacterized protein n=1 Tax=marine metagenome TaxID=408172 RepID=A0A382UZD5_9ZZZZ
MIEGILLAFGCYVAFLFAHVGVFHFFRPKRHYRSIQLTFLGFLSTYVIMYILLSSSFEVLGFLNGILIFFLLYFGYCQFYFIVDRSISVRINIEIENSPNKKLSLEQLKEIYSWDYIFLRRLGHMLDSGYLAKESDGFFNTFKGRTQAQAFKYLKGFLNIGPGG